MAEPHRPSALVEADVFIEESDFENGWTYEDVAEAAWDDICDWVRNGYLPVLLVKMPDGTEHVVDLDQVYRRRLEESQEALPIEGDMGCSSK